MRKLTVSKEQFKNIMFHLVIMKMVGSAPTPVTNLAAQIMEVLQKEKAVIVEVDI